VQFQRAAAALTKFNYSTTTFTDDLAAACCSGQDSVRRDRLTLIQPAGHTFPDCFLLPPADNSTTPSAGHVLERVDMFQITVSNTKEVDIITLGRILNALPDAAVYNLYFAVPNDIFSSFKISSINGLTAGIQMQHPRMQRLKIYTISKVGGTNAWKAWIDRPMPGMGPQVTSFV
jgi:hypothetical protein